MKDPPVSSRIALEPPIAWGLTDEQLACAPTVFKPGLLDGQTYLVSGGGSGIGRAIAYLLARLGADIMICGRRQEKLDETANGIAKYFNKQIATRSMTIRDPHAIEQLMTDTWQRFGRLDGLINNGGGQFPQAALDLAIKGWNAVIDTNLNGTWYMMQAAAKRWHAFGQPGSIVNIVTVISRGMPQVAHTCAARAGVLYLSKTVSTEWAPLNIRVNCVAPGAIGTDGLNHYPRAAAENFRNSNPMRRLGDGHDIAEAVIYLSAASGDFITGEVLVVDGGRQQWGDDWPAGIPDYFRVPGR
jgi:citronellol/citronellal dehydrogenase